ncbi:MAG: HipA domain-containing protein [Polyangiaceae bacterium]
MSVDQVQVELDDAGLGFAVDVGVLSRERKTSVEVVRFAYSQAYLEDTAKAFAIDPELSLFPGDFFARRSNRLFGIFRDTAPDRWGRVLMERREALDAHRAQRKPRWLSEWDFLLGVSDFARVGALRLREVGDEKRYLDHRALGVPPATRLRELEAICLALDEAGSEERSEYESWLRQLLAPGSSLGGARPKATYSATDGTLWIAKFPAKQDRHDVGAWEFLAHELAERAKLRVPQADCLKLTAAHHTFAVRRFDRSAAGRHLYMSAMTALQLDDGDSASYLDVAQALQDLGDPETLAEDLAELYRRLVFNVLVGNRDDHLRNHGFLRGADGWRLAPAFDLNPNPDKSEHALTLDETTARPSVAAVRATSELYRLSSAGAARIETEVRAAFDDWRHMARQIGIPRHEIERLSAVIDPARE